MKCERGAILEMERDLGLTDTEEEGMKYMY